MTQNVLVPYTKTQLFQRMSIGIVFGTSPIDTLFCSKQSTSVQTHRHTHTANIPDIINLLATYKTHFMTGRIHMMVHTARTFSVVQTFMDNNNLNIWRSHFQLIVE